MAGDRPAGGHGQRGHGTSGRFHRYRRPAQVLVTVGVVALVFVLLFRRVDLSAVADVIRDMTWVELATIAAIAVWNFLTYGALWVAVTPGLRFDRAMVVSQAGTALTNTVPGGSALGVRLTYTMLDSWGFSRTQGALAILLSGVWNSFFKFALPVVALALVAVQGDASGRRVAAGAVGFALLATALAVSAALLRRDRAAFWIGDRSGRLASAALRLLRRPPQRDWGPATVAFRARVTELLRRRWPAVTATAVVSHLSLYLVLLVSVRHVGVTDAEVGWAEVLAVFAFARLVTMVRLTPGGAGIVEAVLIGGLVAAGGVTTQVTAAVLVFRALTWLLPVPLGALAYVVWRAGRPRRPTAPVLGAAVTPADTLA